MSNEIINLNEPVEIKLALIEHEPITPLDLFKEDGTKHLIDGIEKAVDEFECDFSTGVQRSKIKTLAADVSRSKTFLEDIGKKIKAKLEDEIAPTLEKIADIDKERSKLKKRLDVIRDKAKKPLIEWEEAEATRKDALDKRLHDLSQMTSISSNTDHEKLSDGIKARIAEVEKIPLDGTWEELAQPAAIEKDKVLSQLEETLQRQLEHEAQQERIEQLEAEAAERNAEQAKKDATANAEKKALADAQKVIDDAKAETVRAQESAKAAAKAERQKIATEKLEEENAEKARAADKEHRAKINRAALDNLMKECSVDNKTGIAVLTAISQGKIANVKIQY